MEGLNGWGYDPLAVVVGNVPADSEVDISTKTEAEAVAIRATGSGWYSSESYVKIGNARIDLHGGCEVLVRNKGKVTVVNGHSTRGISLLIFPAHKKE